MENKEDETESISSGENSTCDSEDVVITNSLVSESKTGMYNRGKFQN